MMSAAASMGMVHQWDIDDGFSALDKFLYVDDVNIKAGGILGIGVCNSGVYVNISLSPPLPAPTHIYIYTHTNSPTDTTRISMLQSEYFQNILKETAHTKEMRTHF